MKKTMKRLWLAAVLTLCAGATASAYDLTVAESEHGTVGFSVGDTAVTTAEAGEAVTITVTPEKGYLVESITARAYTTWASAGSQRRAPGMLKDITLTGDDKQWAFTMPEADVEVFVTYIMVTAIAQVATPAADEGAWYDLNGRRLAGKPAVKGVFIRNGKQIIVK